MKEEERLKTLEEGILQDLIKKGAIIKEGPIILGRGHLGHDNSVAIAIAEYSVLSGKPVSDGTLSIDQSIALGSTQAEFAIETKDFRTYDTSSLSAEDAEEVKFNSIISALRAHTGNDKEALCTNFAKEFAPNNTKASQKKIVECLMQQDVDVSKKIEASKNSNPTNEPLTEKVLQAIKKERDKGTKETQKETQKEKQEAKQEEKVTITYDAKTNSIIISPGKHLRDHRVGELKEDGSYVIATSEGKRTKGCYIAKYGEISISFGPGADAEVQKNNFLKDAGIFHHNFLDNGKTIPNALYFEPKILNPDQNTVLGEDVASLNEQYEKRQNQNPEKLNEQHEKQQNQNPEKLDPQYEKMYDQNIGGFVIRREFSSLSIYPKNLGSYAASIQKPIFLFKDLLPDQYIITPILESQADEAIKLEDFRTYDTSNLSQNDAKKVDLSVITDKLQKIKDPEKKAELCKKFAEAVAPDNKLSQEKIAAQLMDPTSKIKEKPAFYPLSTNQPAKSTRIPEVTITYDAQTNSIIIHPGKHLELHTVGKYDSENDSYVIAPSKGKRTKGCYISEKGEISISFGQDQDAEDQKKAFIRGTNVLPSNFKENGQEAKKALYFDPKILNPTTNTVLEPEIASLHGDKTLYNAEDKCIKLGQGDLMKDHDATKIGKYAAIIGEPIIGECGNPDRRTILLESQADLAIEKQNFRTYDTSNLSQENAKKVDYSVITDKLQKIEHQTKKAELCKKFAEAVAPDNKLSQEKIAAQLMRPRSEINAKNYYGVKIDPEVYIANKIKLEVEFARTATPKEKILAHAKHIGLKIARKIDPEAFHKKSNPKPSNPKKERDAEKQNQDQRDQRRNSRS